MKISGQNLTAYYDPEKDNLEIGLIVQIETDEELKETVTYKQLHLYSTNFGEPVGLSIKGFKQNLWSLNRDLLTLAIILHFDETEREAHYIVGKLYSYNKF